MLGGLASQARALLADEPTTALDVTIQAQVLDMIYKLKHDCNTSMILITHDFGVVAEMCDDVAVIYAEKLSSTEARRIFLINLHIRTHWAYLVLSPI